MPELPEVETICRQLQKNIIGKTIKSADVLYPKVVHNMGATDFVCALNGRKVREVGRQGKLILIRLTGDATLVVHLKMTGRLLIYNPPQPSLTLREGDRSVPPLKVRGGVGGVTRATEVILTFRDGSVLRYDDMRRFGYMKIVPTSEEARVVQREQLGIDFFDRTHTAEKFCALIRSRGGSRIKPLLLDQSLIAGIGNIYAQEACFVAKIHPLRKAGDLSDKELRALYQALRAVMLSAIKYGGTSSDDYRDAFGKMGRFAPRLKVYGREGKPCQRCKTELLKKSVGGRGTVFCPRCQK